MGLHKIVELGSARNVNILWAGLGRCTPYGRECNECCGGVSHE